ncbi:UbiA family prenyltransferase [Streptomyces avicenniae]|uniref:UbiA family prenyltransferase n=1 Tax=Streptomyces avicenniae TaxID=500153 RepID=UPI00069C0AA9|nr:UbiA family prenyltransferase [Streptomyces avicenniae]
MTDACRARPPRLAAHREILRPWDLLTIPLVTATGAALADRGCDGTRVLLAAATGLAACVGTLYAADLLTRHDDRAAKPHRPLPSGRLSEATVARCAVLATVTAVALSLGAAPTALVFIAAAAAAQYAYCRGLKDAGLWGDVMNGLSGWSCCVLAGACFTAGLPSAPLWAVALALGLQGTFSNALLALHDLAADRAAGRRTLAVRLGPEGTVTVLALLAAAAYITAITTPGFLHHRPGTAFFVLLAGAVLLCTGCLAHAAPRPGAPPAPERAIEWHLYERLALPGAFLTLADDGPTVLGPLAAAACLLRLTPRHALRT